MGLNKECEVKGCTKKFDKFNGLRIHMAHQHPEEFEEMERNHRPDKNHYQKNLVDQWKNKARREKAKTPE